MGEGRRGWAQDSRLYKASRPTLSCPAEASWLFLSFGLTVAVQGPVAADETRLCAFLPCTQTNPGRSCPELRLHSCLLLTRE